MNSGRMFLRLLAAMVVSAFFGVGFGWAQKRAVIDECTFQPAEEWKGVQVGAFGRKPVIFGEAYNVPALRFRIFDAEHKPPREGRIFLKYIWHWLRYPYPDHRFGAIEDAWDTLECPVSSDGTVVVPGFVVNTRGWYSGRFIRSWLPPWKKFIPRFYEIEIDVEGACGTGGGLTREAVERYRANPVVMNVVCRYFGK